MKRLFFTVFALLLALQANVNACTTIIVGKGATADGSMIIARNEDASGAAFAQNMFFHPARKQASVFKSNSVDNPANNIFEMALAKGALPYVSFPYWESLNKQSHSFEETGINDYGVAMSATETIFNNARALKADPYNVKNGLTEDSILSIILPYATSAKEGVRLLGGYIEKYGAGEGFGIAFMDAKEIWYLESASGHHWLAQRIPDDSYFVSANQGRFQQADIGDSMHVLSSPGLIEFAAANGFYDPKNEPFNFFNAFVNDGEHDKTYNYPRVRTLLKMYSDIDYKKDDALYPVFAKPKQGLTVHDVARGLRNHYDGTAHDPYMNKNPKEPYRPISVFRTSLSHITNAKPWLPPDIATVQYVAYGMTDLSVFVPFYKGISAIPKEYRVATSTIDDVSLFWKYRKLQALVLQDYPKYAPIVIKEIQALEAKIASSQARMEKKYLKTYLHNPTSASKMIDNFTSDVVARQNTLIAKLTGMISKTLKMDKFTNEQFEEMIIRMETLYHFHGA